MCLLSKLQWIQWHHLDPSAQLSSRVQSQERQLTRQGKNGLNVCVCVYVCDKGGVLRSSLVKGLVIYMTGV